jgi:membrane protein required for colicin V production
MSTIDYVFLGLIIILVLRCALRGFVAEFMTWAALVFGLLVSFLLYRNGAALIRTRLDMEVIPEIIAFVLIFVIIFILVKAVEFLLRDIVERIRLGWLDRLLGVVFGVAEGLVLTALVIFVLKLQPLFDWRPLLEASLFDRILEPLIGEVNLRSVFSSIEI